LFGSAKSALAQAGRDFPDAFRDWNAFVIIKNSVLMAVGSDQNLAHATQV
jgi:hypothetical protein